MNGGKMMQKRRLWFISSLLFLFSFSVLAAGPPRSEKEIPVYPGAVRDQAAEKEVLSQNSEYNMKIQTQRSYSVRVYTAKTIIDEVCKFYINKLSAKPGTPVEDPASIKPGAFYPPWYELDFYGPEIFEDQYERDTLIQDGKWINLLSPNGPNGKKALGSVKPGLNGTSL